MPLVLSETDYKRLTLFAKIGGIFTFAAGSINLFDFGRVWLGLALIVLGIIVTLAPVPMSVLQPDTLAAEEAAERDGMIAIDDA